MPFPRHFCESLTRDIFQYGTSSGKVEFECEMCSRENKAKEFCRQCALFICAQCEEAHHQMRVFAGHEGTSLDKLKESGGIMKECVVPKCTVHGESMKAYCFDCGCCICRDCILKDHQGHKFEFISVAAPEMKSAIAEELIPLKMIGNKLSHAMSNIQNMRSEVKTKEQLLTNSIESCFEGLHNIIESHKSELLAETKKQSSKKLENLLIQEESLSALRAITQSVIYYA